MEGGGVIDDTRAERAVEFYRDNADQRGELRGQIAYLDHAIKISLAQAFLNSEGTVAEREARSRQDADYRRMVEDLRGATTELHTIETKLKAAEMTMELYRTQAANTRRGNI